MQWFKHDSNSSTDAKLKKLILRFGTDGYAIYFHCLELISSDISELNLTFSLEHDAEIIADNLKIKGTPELSSIDKVNLIMKYIIELGLFEESNGRIYCLKMLKRLDTSMTSNTKMRKMITDAKENHDRVMISHDSIMQEEKRREKKRKEKKKEGYTQDFLNWFNLYPKKEDDSKASSFKHWQKKTKSEKEEIIKATKNYIYVCDKKNTKDGYIYKARNFIGRDVRYLDYIEIERQEPEKPKVNLIKLFENTTYRKYIFKQYETEIMAEHGKDELSNEASLTYKYLVIDVKKNGVNKEVLRHEIL